MTKRDLGLLFLLLLCSGGCATGRCYETKPVCLLGGQPQCETDRDGKCMTCVCR